jgi:hypothetical protein
MKNSLPPLKPVKAQKQVKYPLSLKGQLKADSYQPSAVSPWMRILEDGREIIDTGHTQGWKEYRARTRAMLDRQQGVCCLSRDCPTCPGALRIEDAVFEHEFGRGMGGRKRDDRIEADGKPINGAAHWQCNRWKGSLSINYNRP